MSSIAHARNPGKVHDLNGLPLFDWQPTPPAPIRPHYIAARRLAARYGVPFFVALAHAEAAGLGKEAH